MSVSTDNVENSQSERLERLRAQLHGRPVGRRTPPKKTPVPAANLLYGVMLRGAARLDAGLELTDLEEQMLSFLRVMASEEEVREFGRVYREEEASARSARVLPGVLTARGMDEGYAFADLVKDMPDLRAEMAAQSNLNLVDLDRLPEGAPLDSPEFVQALADYGTGVTVVTASDHRPDDAEVAAISEVGVDLNYFKCYRESGEVGRDEIYWALAGSSDLGGQRKSLTREYGGISSGDFVYFDAGTVLFQGQMDNFVSAHIICWEADHSNDDWYDELQRTMVKLADFMKELANRLREYGGHFPVPEYHDLIDYVEVAGMIAMAIAGLIKLFNNPDDFVSERTFVWDRAALQASIDKTDVLAWSFDAGSDGDFVLVMQAKGTIKRGLRLSSAPAGPAAPVWGKHSDLPVQHATTGTPALAASEDRMLCVVRGYPHDNHLYWSMLQGGTWSPLAQITGIDDATQASVAADSAGNFHLVYADATQRLKHWALQGTTWVYMKRTVNGFTGGAPALCRFGSALACGVRGRRDGQLHTATFDPGSTAFGEDAFEPLATNVPTIGDPALGPGSGSVYMAVRGRDDQHVYLTTYGVKPDLVKVPNSATRFTPAIGAAGYGRLGLAIRAESDGHKVQFATYKETDKIWSPFTKPSIADGTEAPAFAFATLPGDTGAQYGRMYCLHNH
ncbi:hypothetical protein ABT236_30575 [Streptomyces sp. NPDC001523]|uniref:hypothetical protein n=1 Tax=Streptomyces sp. NPDC001523 TaxID=3154383 RepID=UPI003320576A